MRFCLSSQLNILEAAGPNDLPTYETCFCNLHSAQLQVSPLAPSVAAQSRCSASNSGGGREGDAEVGGRRGEGDAENSRHCGGCASAQWGRRRYEIVSAQRSHSKAHAAAPFRRLRMRGPHDAVCTAPLYRSCPWRARLGCTEMRIGGLTRAAAAAAAGAAGERFPICLPAIRSN